MPLNLKNIYVFIDMFVHNIMVSAFVFFVCYTV